MRKYGKVLAGVVAVTMLLASVMGVSAANSSTADVTVSGDKYAFVAEGEAFKGFETTNQDLYDALVDYNKKPEAAKLDKVLTGASDAVKKEVQGKTAVTKFYDLKQVSSEQVDGKHKVTLTVPTLTDNLEDVVVLHYNNGAWEVVKATVSGQTVTVELDSLGVIGIYASLKQAGSDATGGTNSTWMVAVALVVVAAGAVVLMSQRKKNA